MSDHDRGAYTPPTDAPLSFDPRQPVRGARPFPFTLIVSALVLIGLAAAIVLFYRTGVRQAGQPPQAVGVPVDAMKTPAPAGAQPQDPAADLQIYRSGAPQQPAAQPQFTSPPEEPQARPQPVPATAAAQGSSNPPAKAAAPPLAPKAAPAPAPAPKAAAAPAPAPKAAPAPTPAKTAGTAAVQVGAVASTALADRTWREAVAVAPSLAAGKGKGVERIEKAGQTLYRTSVTGFASKAEAAAFCSKLKAAGKACFVK